MDAIRRNKQIDSLKYLLSKCQDGGSILSAMGSREDSKLSSEMESSVDALKDDSMHSSYQDPLVSK